MFKRLKCLATGHQVNRHRVWHDNQNFRTKCANCQTPLIRIQGNWIEFDAAEFDLSGRASHPVSGKVA